MNKNIENNKGNTNENTHPQVIPFTVKSKHFDFSVTPNPKSSSVEIQRLEISVIGEVLDRS